MLPIKRLFTKILQYLVKQPPNAQYFTISASLEAGQYARVQRTDSSDPSGSASGFLIIDGATGFHGIYHCYITTDSSIITTVQACSSSSIRVRARYKDGTEISGITNTIRVDKDSGSGICYVRFFKIAGNAPLQLVVRTVSS